MQDPQQANALALAEAKLIQKNVPSNAILYLIHALSAIKSAKNNEGFENFLSYKIDKNESNYINIIGYLCDAKLIKSGIKTAADLEIYAQQNNLEMINVSIPHSRILKIQNLNYKPKNQ